MNTRPLLTPSEGVSSLSAAFNQDTSCFAVGLHNGFAVINSDPSSLRVFRDFKAGIGKVEMLGRANYLALVGGGKNPKFPQNKVIIWDDAKQKVVITLELKSEVYSVRLSRSRIIVVLLNSVHIYAFSSPPQKQHVFETADNPLGLACLSSKSLIFPGRQVGHVNVFDLATSNISIIPAHTSTVVAMAMSADGDMVATASETGTLIRVFSSSTCAQITEFRRGADKATIFSIAISPNSARLAVTSDKSTLHVYDLMSTPAGVASTNAPGSQGAGSPEGNRRFSLLGKLPLLPKYFSSQWSFAHAKFEGLGRTVIGWTAEDTVVVVSPQDCKWEKFVIINNTGPEGGKVCEREGWRTFIDNVTD